MQTCAIFGGLFKQDVSEKTRKKYQKQVDLINELEPAAAKLTDDELRAKTLAFKKRVLEGESVDSLLVEAFAVSLCIFYYCKCIAKTVNHFWKEVLKSLY